MILTNCAACAAPLAHDAPRCVRCATRYCSATCQQDHWRRGHKGICKKIHRGGNAEQHHANKKYEEAVAAAVAKCAEAVTTLEDAKQIARRVLGSAHPTTAGIEKSLREARAALCARETPPPPLTPTPLYDEDELD